MNVLLTGASGFVGQHLAFMFESISDFNLTSVVRSDVASVHGARRVISEIDGDTDWLSLLTDKDLIVHAAARAHVMTDEGSDFLEEYRRINVDGTLNLARQAALACVKRFIFISSIKVNGEQTSSGRPFTADDRPAPEDAYGISKLEAEQGLLQIAEETGLEVVIIRPPLVYGPRVKGNFLGMIKVVKKRIPLPLGAIYNRRSLVSIDNLVDLVVKCTCHPEAANQVFLAGDGCDLSTTELLKGVAKAAGVSACLVPIPASILMFIASLLGKRVMAQRLLGSLQVDISKARDLLGWTPPLSVEEGLRRCFILNTGRR